MDSQTEMKPRIMVADLSKTKDMIAIISCDDRIRHLFLPECEKQALGIAERISSTISYQKPLTVARVRVAVIELIKTIK